MDRAEFTTGMMQIMNRFGSKRYTPEINGQIWDAWQYLPVNPWQRLINDFLIRKTTPPTPIDFINAAKSEASRRSQVRPVGSRNVISMFGDQERNEMFRLMESAGKGSVAKKDAVRFCSLLQRAIDARSAVKCRKCSDEGILSARLIDQPSNPYVFKCDCNAGGSRQEEWPQWNSGMRSKFVPEDEAFRKELSDAEQNNDDGPEAS